MFISRIHPGNIRRYDIGSRLTLPMVRQNFEALEVDPYVKEGFRRKHLIRFIVEKKDTSSVQLLPIPQEPLFQRKQYNPVHGELHREYPIFHPTLDTMRVIACFVQNSSVCVGQRILVQAQRITCTPGTIGLPSVEDWHQDDVNEIGIMCVTRYNLKGGENQFKEVRNDHIILKRTLEEGEMLIFEDANIKHRVTPIHIADNSLECGFRDVLLMSHGGCT